MNVFDFLWLILNVNCDKVSIWNKWKCFFEKGVRIC